MRLLRREVSLASAAARVQPRLHQVRRLPHRRLGCQAPERRGKLRRKLNRVLPPELRSARLGRDFFRSRAPVPGGPGRFDFLYTGAPQVWAAAVGARRAELSGEELVQSDVILTG